MVTGAGWEVVPQGRQIGQASSEELGWENDGEKGESSELGASEEPLNLTF